MHSENILVLIVQPMFFGFSFTFHLPLKIYHIIVPSKMSAHIIMAGNHRQGKNLYLRRIDKHSNQKNILSLCPSVMIINAEDAAIFTRMISLLSSQ